jgi:hypothetical protein
MISVSKHFSTTLHIDGQRVAIRISKFTPEDSAWFVPRFEMQGRDFSAAQEELQQFAERWRMKEAQARGVPPTDVPLPDEDRLTVLYEQELGPERTAQRRRDEIARDEAGNAFAMEAITRFVSVEPGQIYDTDIAREVLTGADFAQHFIGGRPQVIFSVMARIFAENRLPDEIKKKLSLQFDSRPTSPASSTAAGPRPAGTAPSAAAPATAATARARGPRGKSLSGPMPRSSAGSAPS